MAKLRKKYYSLKTKSFVELPTDVGSNFQSSDIGSSIDDETIRLIRFDTDADSSKVDEMVSDLLYNDIALNSELKNLSSLMSDGIFYSVGDGFSIYNVDKQVTLNGTYIKSFAIKSGQIKYGEEVHVLNSTKNYYLVNPIAGSLTTVTFDTIESLEIGTFLFGSEFQSGTRITQIVDNIVTFSKPLKKELIAPSLVLAYEMPTFAIGEEIPEIASDSQIYPIYRRDLISYDLINNSWEVLSSPVLNIIPPTNTQLDLYYQIESLTWSHDNIFALKCKNNYRSMVTDFSIGQEITLLKTNNKFFDGDWVITEINPSQNIIYLNILIQRDATRDQVIPGGFIDLKKIGLFSILSYKASVSTETLIFDSIKQIANFSGLNSGIQNLIHCELNDRNGLYELRTGDDIHLVDIEGRLLDWEEGQDSFVLPELGYNYNENNLTNYDESQVPYDYKELYEGNLFNIPFKVTESSSNVFGLQTVDVALFNLGIRNNPISIGNEGIEYRVVIFPQLLSETKISSVNTIKDVNENIVEIIINNPLINFPNYNISIERGDFILITDGPGSYGIGKIINISTNSISVIGLYKPLTNETSYAIFKNELSIIEHSENFLVTDSIRSQVLSGVNGYFGNGAYSKIALDYSNNYPKVALKQWYFLQLKGYNATGNPSLQGTPYIIVEDPDNTSSKYTSPYISVFYRTISGKYPNGNLLIEDEFGDISLSYIERTAAPHFRPTRYQLIAKNLDENISFEQEPEDVFVDVHTGRIKFHSNFIPKKLFISYNKYDTLDGNATDFNIKHIDSETYSKSNLQDKITEIENRLTYENTINKVWSVNGLISNENDGFSGPIEINPDNNYGIIYKDDRFSNHTFDEERYNAKFSGHLYDNIVLLEKNSLLTENIKFTPTIDSDGNSYIAGTLISNFDHADISSGTASSGISLPSAGLNFYDEAWTPSSINFVNNGTFYKKKKVFESPNDKSLLDIDTKINGDLGLSGAWNSTYVTTFDKNMVLHANIRKSNYEDLLIDANKEVKRRFKQREILKLTNSNLDVINSEKSATKILAEKYFTKNNVLGSIKHNENFILLKSEITKYKDYRFLPAQNIVGNSFNLSDIEFLNNNNLNSSKYETLFINNRLITVYSDFTNNNNPTIRVLPFSQGDESSDITSYSNSFSFTPSTLLAVLDLHICAFNDTLFAVAGAYRSTLTGKYTIIVGIYDTINLSSNSQPLVSSVITTDIVGPYTFNLYNVSYNKLAFVWKKSATEIALRVLTYTNGAVTLTDSIIIESSSSLNEAPQICSFLSDKFLVAYNNEAGIRLKLFDLNGKLEFFNNEKTIDYRMVSTSYFSTGNKLSLIELDNNNIVISFLERDSENKINIAYAILDAYTKSWVNPQSSINNRYTLPIIQYVAKDINDDSVSISTKVLTEDVFIIAYRTSTLLNLKAYQNDGGEFYNSYNVDLLSLYNSLQIHKVGPSTIISTYGIGNLLKFSVFNFRPDFTKNTEIGKVKEIEQTLHNDLYFKIFNYGNSSYIALQKTVAGFSLKLIDAKDKTGHTVSTSILPLSFNLTNVQSIVDCKYISYNSTYGLINIVAILYSTTDSNALKIKLLLVRDTFLKDAGDITLLAGADTLNYSKNFGTIIYLRDGYLGILLKNSITQRVIIHGLSLKSLENSDSFGTVSSLNYTMNINKLYNRSDTFLSGVRKEYSIPFISDANYGVLIYNGLSGVVHSSKIDFGNTLKDESDQLDFSSINILSRETLLRTSNGTGDISFIADSTDSNSIYFTTILTSSVSGSASGSGIIFNANFNAGYLQGSVTSGTFYAATGTNAVYGIPFIENTNSVSSLQVHFAAGISSGSNTYYNINYFKKKTFEKFAVVPDTKILLPSPISKSIAAVKDDTYNVYSNFVSTSPKLSGVTWYPSSFGNSIENEAIIKETVDGQIRNRLYTKISLKLTGLDWRGNLLKTNTIFSINSVALQDSQIDSDGVFRSEFDSISASIISISKSQFCVVYFYHKDNSNDIKIKLRNFIINKGRIFPDSPWYDSAPDFSYQGIRKSIGLQVIKNNKGLLYIWIDPIDSSIKQAIVDRFNVPLANTFKEIDISNGTSVSPQWLIIGGGELVDSWSSVLIYDRITKKYRTILWDPNGDLVSTGLPFALPFVLETTLRSQVKMTKWGYFIWTYYDVATKTLKYYQHGFDGSYLGLLKIVGKNYLTNIDSSPNSPFSKNIKSDLIEDNLDNVKSINESSKALSSGQGYDLLNKINTLMATVSGNYSAAFNSLINTGKIPVGGIIAIVGVSLTQGGTTIIPSGILPNSGVISPTGFMLCNGAQIPAESKVNIDFRGKYTPTINDNRFIRGVANSGNLGNIGGNANYSLSEGNIPLHSHGLLSSGKYYSGASTVQHTHNGTTALKNLSHNHGGVTDGTNTDHTHAVIPYGATLSFNTGGGNFRVPYTRDGDNGVVGTGGMSGNQVHTHGFRTGDASIDMNHSHAFATDIPNESTSHTHELLPFGLASVIPIPIEPQYINAIYLIRVCD